ncbi:hypothetical protein AURANDRAFT_67714 [Aureococcus anophagefferens]|uniref:RGS domain-containing protein n=1 Tax=Aureococcus anophagefferens TaxID=44056 RepID=F0YM53_AURAN|nr:hypothetical protein AURANDRAFT_67714 [Aureococcus anophagefferens]EGB03818.1 hypothetical protein AURANDRAFT_67714 [Aureococcus anophagefferens]|eukprot:XP_009041476.1 hypothetical protein AURANDRAFT_67714 [Aureococcus anophagefferens]
MGRISSHEFGSMDDKIWLLEHVFETQQTQAEKVPELKATDLTKLAEAFQPVTFAADDVVILAGDEDESHARLVLFRTGGAEVNAALLDDDHADADGGKRKSIKKNKRITRLKSPFYVGEGWILTGNTPKAYALPKEKAKRLTSAGNTSIKLIKRDLKICAFERAHLHGFVNTLFQKNLDDDDLMAAFDGYGKEAFCTESFDFCREVHAFKRDVVDLDFPSSKSRLAKISEAYFQSGILNLSAKQRKALDKAKDDAEAQGDSKILVEGLENPLQQVYKEIQQSHITPFMKSKHYNGFLAEKFPIPVVRRTLLVRAAKGGGGGGKDDSGACVVS